MKPFEPATQELKTGNGLVKRSTFMRILRRIASLSGVQLAPLSRASETPGGAEYKLNAGADLRQWGVQMSSVNTVSVGIGCVMVDGRNGHFLLDAGALRITAAVGFVGVAATVQYVIGGDDNSPPLGEEWMGWTTLTGIPRLEFRASPDSSFVEIDYDTGDCPPAEIFVPLAFIENGSVTDLIRDGIVIGPLYQNYGTAPMFAPVLV